MRILSSTGFPFSHALTASLLSGRVLPRARESPPFYLTNSFCQTAEAGQWMKAWRNDTARTEDVSL
ncbi:hypothetical protein GQ42DRAFT_35726 [Ramicandelaber brevisporus]|nr:hypothetical protein GQ42DRAFT_50847 [Ramicandelaber brevisporus]KAI8868835.1 hypothetical protein GQ42DRAFT_35726 [Ramicandelaber brevisporus]